MPIKHGKSNKDFQENITREKKMGKKLKQAVKIAYVEADNAKKRDAKEKRAHNAKKKRK